MEAYTNIIVEMENNEITRDIETLRDYLGECIIEYYEFLMDDVYGEILPYKDDEAFIILSVDKNYYYRNLKNESYEGLIALYNRIEQ